MNQGNKPCSAPFQDVIMGDKGSFAGSNKKAQIRPRALCNSNTTDIVEITDNATGSTRASRGKTTNSADYPINQSPDDSKAKSLMSNIT